MTASTSRNTISRQWELLKLLPARQPGISASELASRLHAAGFHISKRTVERDLNELSCIFPLQCNSRSMPWGWYWQPGSSAELPGLSVAEALSLYMAEQHLQPLLPGFMLESLQPRFTQARQKLAALQDQQPLARWSQRIASVAPEMHLLAPQIDSSILDSLHQALMEDRQLRVLYQSAGNPQARERTLNPLGLIQRGKVTYLAASAEPWQDVRLYALQRMQQATLLASATQPPAGFCLDTYIASGALQFISPGSGQIELQARIRSKLAHYLLETPLSSDMQLQPAGDDWHHLQASVQDSWQLRWWLLSHTGDLVIEQPASLREEIAERLRSGMQLYASAAEPATGS